MGSRPSLAFFDNIYRSLDAGASWTNLQPAGQNATGGDKQWKMLRSGSSYLAQSELVLTFGLGTLTKADSVEIQWPSGQVDKLSNIDAGQTVTVQEGKGVIAKRAYGPKKTETTKGTKVHEGKTDLTRNRFPL